MQMATKPPHVRDNKSIFPLSLEKTGGQMFLWFLHAQPCHLVSSSLVCEKCVIGLPDSADELQETQRQETA